MLLKPTVRLHWTRVPMKPSQLDALRGEPAHWTTAGFYRCSEDPRLVVHKRYGGGWTINVAHRRAWFVLIAVVGVAVAPLVAKAVLGSRAPGWLFVATVLTPIFVTVLAAAWLGRSRR